MIGSTLSHYKITAELGRGGMGIVYRATDTKLNRDVALKILPAAALASEEDRARFFREAQAAAQLHHPNIATVFEIDEAIPQDADGNPMAESDGPRPFIAIEFLQGESLQEMIQKGPMKLDEAVRICAQIAAALKAAHAKNIVHRDIKGANVMLTTEGVAKVLDFGLAKTNQSTQLTRMGSTLGTIAYMSPEQAKGQDVDGRSDLYSLGTVFYEMIAGRLPFTADYEQAVVYSILNEDPEPLTGVRTGVPMGLEWIVNKLLSKEPGHRYQTAADLIADLETVDLSGEGLSRRSMPAVSTIGSAPAMRKRKLPDMTTRIVAGAILLIAVATTWFVASLQNDDAYIRTSREFTLNFSPLTDVGYPVVSPDGSFLVFMATDDSGPGVWMDRFDGNAPEKLPLTGGEFFLQVSIDNRFIVSSDPLQVYSIETGHVETILPASERAFAAVRPEIDEVVYADIFGPLVARPLSGGPARQVTEISGTETSQTRHIVLPSGKGVMTSFTVASMDSARIEFVDFDTGERQPLISNGYSAIYLQSGHLLYYKGAQRSAFVVPFDMESGTIIGNSMALGPRYNASKVSVDQYGNAFIGRSTRVDLGRTGRIIHVAQNGSEAYLNYETPSGTIFPSASSDGSRVAFYTNITKEVFIFTEGQDAPSQVIPTNDSSSPQLSPSGEFIAFRMLAEDTVNNNFPEPRILVRNLNSGKEYSLGVPFLDRFDWAGDDNIVYSSIELAVSPGQSPFGTVNTWNVSSGTSTELFSIENQTRLSASTDGNWVLYTAQSGNTAPQILLRNVKQDQDPIIISNGNSPVWSPEGNRIYYGSFTNQIYYIDIELSESDVLSFGASGRIENYDLSVSLFLNDGEMIVLEKESIAQGGNITMKENWLEEVKRLAPVDRD